MSDGFDRPVCSVDGCDRPAVALMVTPLVDGAYRCLLDLEYDIDRNFFEDDPAWYRSEAPTAIESGESAPDVTH